MPGGLLTATRGLWSFEPTRFRYRWQASLDGSSWATLGSSTGPSFILPLAFKPGRVRVQVTALNAAGSATSTSAPHGRASLATKGVNPEAASSVFR